MRRNTEIDKGTVVVIDDDQVTLLSIAQMLRLRKYKVQEFTSAEKAIGFPGLMNADCILTDVRMPGMDGEELLKRITSSERHPPVIMITGHGDISMAVRCLKSGAYDFVTKPFDDEVLLAGVARAIEKNALAREHRELKSQLEQLYSTDGGRFGMVGTSLPMRDLYEQIECVAASDAPVLIIGETGVGKELVARAIHSQSNRAGGRFVPVNAGALPESMLESELFGHAKGAFTGAEKERDGKLISASKGTLLLDEIESISLRAQVQLLRVLEDGVVYPLGSDTRREVQIRLLATTKADLREEVRKGEFREDFYHRIAVLSISVPPLRQRPDDIPLLISHFMKLIAERDGVPTPTVSEERLAEMMKYHWPGNVRELRNAVERLVITIPNRKPEDFGPVISSPVNDTTSDRLVSLPHGEGKLKTKMEQTEKEVIKSALTEQKGEVSRVARTLGISRRALYERMKKYGLSKDMFKA